MKIEILDITKLIPYANNPRHNLPAVDKVAASIKEFGFKQPIVVDKAQVVVVGHTRLLAAQKLGLTEVPVVIAAELSDAQIKAYRLADNRINEEASWDREALAIEIEELKSLDFDLDLTGFELDELNFEVETLPPGEPDTIPEMMAEAVSLPGDIWLLGKHRIMCGDSTAIGDVEKLMHGKKAVLLHADPPYGMGKEKDGVENDNLYEAELDRFQMEWFATFRPFIVGNASIYIWGNAPELWRLWYLGGLAQTKELNLVNEIVWAKVHSGGAYDAIGQSSAEMRCYPPAGERCLFLTLGETNLNTNANNYFVGWEPIRTYLNDELSKANLTKKAVDEITGCQMYPHWFAKSQWQFIKKQNYEALQAATGFFTKPYAELNKEYLAIKRIYDGEVTSDFHAGRAYFDNTHANMADVWNFERVKGDERHGHATPKPVAMMERIVQSSAKKHDLVVEPFAGSGSTLIACEKANRVCYTMEITPRYVDVVVKRWQDFTGKKAVLASNGKSFDEMINERSETES